MTYVITDIKLEVKNGEVILMAQKMPLDRIPETHGTYYGVSFRSCEYHNKWEVISKVKIPEVKNNEL